MSNKILIYTMEGCGHCNKLKNKLDSNKISYTNRDINTYNEEYEKVAKKLDTDFIPLVNIKNTWLVPEKNFNTIDECVEIIKSMI